MSKKAKTFLPIFPTIEYNKTYILSSALSQICQIVVITFVLIRVFKYFAKSVADGRQNALFSVPETGFLLYYYIYSVICRTHGHLLWLQRGVCVSTYCWSLRDCNNTVSRRWGPSRLLHPGLPFLMLRREPLTSCYP